MSTNDRSVWVGGIDWPESLIDALRQDRLVVFAGAGVSMGHPAHLPDFEQLADAIASGHPRQLKRIKVGNSDESAPNDQDSSRPYYRVDEPIDSFMGELHRSGVAVQNRAARILQDRNPRPNNLHFDLVRLFTEPSRIRLVTTNFDTLFEQAAASIFGNPKRGSFEDYRVKGGYLSGVYHIHGDWDDPSSIVITDSEFAASYVNPGGTQQYLLDLFRQFSVLFVGYSLSDTLMRYLSMAIEPSPMTRYVLTDDLDPNRWQAFDMTPIGYEKSRDHCGLIRGVHEFANFAEWSSTDWEREICRIVSSGVPTSKGEEDLVKQALRDPVRARTFRDYASSPEWIGWLGENDFLAELFESEELGWLQSTFSYWIANSHALQHSNEVFDFVANYPDAMNPRFWADIAHTISNQKYANTPNPIVGRWVSVLLSRSPGFINEHLVVSLIEASLKHDGLGDQSLALLEHVIKTRVVDDAPEPARSRNTIYWRDDGLAWALKMIWGVFSERIDAFAEPLTEVITRNIFRQHRIAWTWGGGNSHGPWLAEFEPIPYLNEEKPRNPGSVMIGMVANSLAWMAQNQSQSAEEWVARFCDSRVEILRRLATSTVAYLDWKPDKKIEWLIDNRFHSDRSVQTEAQVLAKIAFLDCCVANREALITSIVAGNPEPRGCTCDAPMSDDRQFDWLSKLRAVDPDCQVVAQALQPLQESHPEWNTDAFAEREPVSATAYRIHEAPLIPVNKLLSQSIGTCVDQILACACQIQETRDGDDIVRKSVPRTVFEASSQDVEWGLQVASELSRRGVRCHDIWRQLLLGWVTCDLDDRQFEAAIDVIAASELLSDHGRLIATILRRRIEHRQNPYPTDLTIKCKELAIASWESVANLTVDDYRDDWWTEAWQSSAGDVTNFWVKSLWLESKKEQNEFPGLSPIDRNFLDALMSDASVRGLFGKSILGSYSAALLVIDLEWTKENLLPLFDLGNGSSSAVWDGLAGSKTFTPHLAESMQPMFLKALTCLRDHRYWASDEVRRGFINKFVIVMMCNVNDPVTAWIPAFFDNSTDDDRVEFAIQIRETLAGARDDQRTKWWETSLKEYWQNRLEGVPVRLETKEIGMMMQWVQHLGPRFGEGVDFAMKTPFEPSFVSSLIVDCEIAEKHPVDSARFLIFIDEFASDSSDWHQMDAFFDVLLRSNLDDCTKSKIRNVITKRTPKM